MKIIDRVIGFLGGKKRSYSAATTTRFNMDWLTQSMSADSAMRGKLESIRDRARDLERNNEWVGGYFRALENNVIGETGIALQMRIKQEGTGNFDEIANDKIETAFYNWGKVRNCTTCRRYSWRDVQKLVLRAMKRDGEALIRLVRNTNGLRLQLIECDLLDGEAHYKASNGNDVRFGVEMNLDREVVAYHLLSNHPGDGQFPSSMRTKRRVPADEMIHLFKPDRIGQTRGVSCLTASMQRLKMLDGYAEAELVAARTGAAKMGFFQKKTPDGWSGETDDQGNLSMSAAPGSIEELPVGVEFKSWDTDHPNAGYGGYVKSMLRGISTSLGISYNSLANDLEGVNYSSIRAGLLEEREEWKSIQRYLIEHLCEPIFTEWLTIELLSGRLGLPFSKMWKFNVPEFSGRRWGWVDPKKDMEAAILAVRSGQKSLRQIIAETNGDIYDVARSMKADKELFASLGVELPELTDAPKQPAQTVEVDTDQ